MELSLRLKFFQRKMHELIEGLNGVEVIADDFVVVGYLVMVIHCKQPQRITTRVIQRSFRDVRSVEFV